MKRDTISFFRLSLAVIGYLIYNILFYSYPSGSILLLLGLFSLVRERSRMESIYSMPMY